MKLVSALAKVGGFTSLSRVLGFLRDLVFARLFGANEATDAFFVAFKLPNLFRRIFAELGVPVVIHEMRPRVGTFAHKTGNLAEVMAARVAADQARYREGAAAAGSGD